MVRLSLLLTLVAFVAIPASAQSLDVWSDASSARVGVRTDVSEFRTVRLDEPTLRAAMAPVATARQALRLTIPLPEGGSTEVEVAESSVMAPELQTRYPEIRTYTAEGPGASGRLSLTEHGFRGVLFDEAGTIVVDPSASGSDLYIVYRAEDLVVPEDLLAELGDDDVHIGGGVPDSNGAEARRAGAIGESLRTYRLAVSARGEYVQANGGTVESGLAAIAESVARLNAIYERDLAVTFQLVANNDQIIYTDPATDPFEGTGTDLFAANTTSTDAAIGVGGYDIGHVIGYDEGGGVAYVGATCNDFVTTDGRRIKAGGVSGVGDERSLFDLVVFPHEVGHQMGAPHTWVSYALGIESNSAGVEPGPGYTIMAYGQFATGGPGRIERPAAERIGFYFHAASIRVMDAYTRNGGGNVCGTDTATGNDVPEVTVPQTSYRIPTGTPFRLDGSATDGSGTALTYTWDQIDPYRSGNLAVPVFRSFGPDEETERYFPGLDRLIAGELLEDEGLLTRALPHVFEFTVRDNAAGGGGVGTEEVVVRVYDTDGAFEVTSQALPVVYAPGADIEVTWNVAGTDVDDQQPVTLVDVLVTYDGGETLELVLDDVPNDGAASFSAPTSTPSGGHIMVRAEGNVFFAVSSTPFTVGTAPVADISTDRVLVQEEPGGVIEVPVPIANGADASTTLIYSARLENLELPSGAVVERPGGYSVISSEDENGPAHSFETISTVAGSEIDFGTNGQDDGIRNVSLPFSFPFYGETFDQVAVSTNGLLVFGTTGSDASNQPIPTDSNPNGFLAPLWDDLVIGTGSIHAATLSDGRFVVEYNQVGQFSGFGDYTFQAILSPDGTIQFVYELLLGDTSGATVGVEAPDGARGIEVSYNSGVVSNTSYEFAPTWLEVRGTDGTLAGGESGAVRLLLNSTRLPEDYDLRAELVVQTNDGANAVKRIPVRFTDVGVALPAETAPALAEVSLLRPNPTATSASVRVSLAAPTQLVATVHDALGREVARLHDGQAAGELDLRVDAGRLAAGVYLVRVAGDGFAETRSLVVAR